MPDSHRAAFLSGEGAGTFYRAIKRRNGGLLEMNESLATDLQSIYTGWVYNEIWSLTGSSLNYLRNYRNLLRIFTDIKLFI